MSEKSNNLLNKVPEITLYFWIIKILCTTVGETFADFLNINVNLGLIGTTVFMGVLLLIALFFQFKKKSYTPSIYWLSVALISVFGTLVTDILTDSIGVPLEASTIFFSIILGLTFFLWYRSEKTLSIHSIFTKRREAFYWLTILFTFALGTAAGDLMAEGLGLGYLLTGIIVATLIAGAVSARRFGLNSVLSFWIIYILTRPLGASLGDYLSQPHKYGGLGLGATGTSVLFIAGIIGLVAYLSYSRRDVISSSAVKEEGNEQGALIQTLATVGLVLVLAGTGYVWRQKALQAHTKSDTHIVTVASTTPTVNNTPEKMSSTSTLGDLSVFRKITEDTRNLVIAGNLSGAKDHIGDLEYEWDNAEARLKAMDKEKWHEIDDAIDNTLRQLRSIDPDAEKSKLSLDALLVVLK